ncbi:MAG: TIM barrel protein [Prolixibacteraceae bacterium]
MKGKGPGIYLAIDNCFASKRWTEPEVWFSVIKDLGIYHVETSADTESDPLYSTDEYLSDWLGRIRKLSEKTGVQVNNLYSGHGTYSTLGLSHTDARIRKHIRDNWLKKMIDNAAAIDAGLGFFCHAFNQAVLNNPEEYEAAKQELYQNLAYLADYAATKNRTTIGVEQMYTPHQIPWTVKGARELMQQVKQLSGNPFYITIDTGHQSGQRKFRKPGKEQLKTWLEELSHTGFLNEKAWVGNLQPNDLLQEINKRGGPEDAAKTILEKLENRQYLFASDEDGDPYYWLEKLACYSPIIHLQQTDGKSSAHKPFTRVENEKGIIHGPQVLRAIQKAYETETDPTMPEKCKEIFLTIEVFSSTADLPHNIIRRLEETVEYWRKYIPKDGMLLNETVK